MSRAPAPLLLSPPPIVERFAHWAQARIFNDREADLAAVMVLMGTWISIWIGRPTHTSWVEIFSVIPRWMWGTTFGGLGLLRLRAAIWYSSPEQRSLLALVSCAVFAFFAVIVLLIDHRLMLAPLFAWFSYMSAKSSLRISINRRLEANGDQR